jgi:hypothetical protein
VFQGSGTGYLCTFRLLKISGETLHHDPETPGQFQATAVLVHGLASGLKLQLSREGQEDDVVGKTDAVVVVDGQADECERIVHPYAEVRGVCR